MYVSHENIFKALKLLNHKDIDEENEDIDIEQYLNNKDIISLAFDLEIEQINKEKESLIIRLTDMLHQKGENEIVTLNLSEYQKERYKIKKNIAIKVLDGDTTAISLLTPEAIERNISVESLAELILNLGDIYLYEQEKLITELEVLRFKFNQLSYEFLVRLYKEVEKNINEPIEIIRARILNEFTTKQ